MKTCSVFATMLLAAASSWMSGAYADTTEPSVLVTATAAHRGSLARTVTAYGAVLAPPSATRTMEASIPQTVGSVYVFAGEEVGGGTPLLQLEPDPQTAAAFERSRVASRVAGEVAARTHELFKQHLATAQELATARKAATDARITLEALRTQGAGAPRTLRSPWGGIVLRVSATPGAHVAAGTGLITLARAQELVLRVGVAPSEAREIHAGDAARVLPLGAAQAIGAKVTGKGAAVDGTSGLIAVDLALPRDTLFPGQSARATITVGQINGFVVPHDAVLIDEKGSPYVVQIEGGKARTVPVRILGSKGDKDVLEAAALNAAQRIVLSGNYQLRDGMPVRFAADEKGLKK